MKTFGMILTLCLLTAPAMAEEEHSQEYYDQQVAQNVQELTSQMQQMSDTFIKYMNAVNKVLGESLPQMNENLSKAISSMQPLATTMQKNFADLESQLNIQAAEEDETYPLPAAVRPELASTQEIAETDENISAAIDEELAAIHIQNPENTKIKLFPSSVE